jgi:catechol 2,3-dioxygenase-like lactoylglutathione lyase family enzyme
MRPTVEEEAMFRDTKAFSGFSVNDIEAARTFYGETLGLDVRDGPMGLLELHVAGGTPILVYPKDDHAPATFTILNFPVDDIDAAVERLAAAGVTFERYPHMGEADATGVYRGLGGGPDIAWFRDPAGNVLSVLSDGPG